VGEIKRAFMWESIQTAIFALVGWRGAGMYYVRRWIPPEERWLRWWKIGGYVILLKSMYGYFGLFLNHVIYPY
jgi:hypothetical protein